MAGLCVLACSLLGEPRFTAGWMELSASPQATQCMLAAHHRFLEALAICGGPCCNPLPPCQARRYTHSPSACKLCAAQMLQVMPKLLCFLAPSSLAISPGM